MLPVFSSWHQVLSQPVQASFSQSEEVFYKSHITKEFAAEVQIVTIVS